MTTTLTYGKGAVCEFDAVDDIVRLGPADCRALSADEIVTRVCSQLEQPLEYPPLSQATIPGDRVVVAVQRGLPQLQPIVLGALQALHAAGVEDSLITVLLSYPSATAECLRQYLAKQGFEQCCVAVHDADDEKQIALLGVTQAGQALRLNRLLCDADFVLPIGVTCCRAGNKNLRSSFANLFTLFSDRETISRYARAGAEHFPALAPENAMEAEECARHLGLGLCLQVTPGATGNVVEVLAGEPTVTHKAAQEVYRSIWCKTAPSKAALVIATLTGEPEEQTWRNLGRALAAACSIVTPGGAIAICSELNEPVGEALSQLAGNDDWLAVERQILRTKSEDCGIAMQVCRVLQQGPIYLLSQLRPSVVESLGISPLESDSELERLAQSMRPCVVLEEAQRLLICDADTE